MLNRCNPKYAKLYPAYAAKHTTICEGFRNYEHFEKILGERTHRKLTLDRIDNDGNYTCEKCDECKRNGWKLNCRWATSEQQYANRNINNRNRHHFGASPIHSRVMRIFAQALSEIKNSAGIKTPAECD